MRGRALLGGGVKVSRGQTSWLILDKRLGTRQGISVPVKSSGVSFADDPRELGGRTSSKACNVSFSLQHPDKAGMSAGVYDVEASGSSNEEWSFHVSEPG